MAKLTGRLIQSVVTNVRRSAVTRFSLRASAGTGKMNRQSLPKRSAQRQNAAPRRSVSGVLAHAFNRRPQISEHRRFVYEFVSAGFQ